MLRRLFVPAVLLAGACASAASADVVISKAPTMNMSCSGGTCTPTKKDAVLNVGDLETMLSSGDLQVNAGERSIHIDAPVTWSAATTLTLTASSTFDRRKYIYIDKRISVAGTGNLVLNVGDILDLVFGQNAAVQFANGSSTLSIGGASYQLVSTLSGLASAIAANPSGNFALANSYDAGADGTYAQSPVTTNFLGTFEGLGNTISNISVNNTSACCVGGLFLSLSQAYIFNIHLANVNVVSTSGAAGFAYESFAGIYNVSVTGTVTGGSSGDIAGLISDDYGQIESAYSSAAVSTGPTVADVNVGGLVGVEYGTSGDSFATGNVSEGNGSGNIGGLIGLNSGAVGYCYATGAVSGGTGVTIGGLVGKNAGGAYAAICYSTAALAGGSGSIVGGFMGENDSTEISYDYWDTTTSGTDIGVGLGNASNITGLTTEQLQSGLPPGFTSRGWKQKAGVNNGFPYLRSNPPPK